MNEFRFQTIGEFARWKADRRDAVKAIVFIAFYICVIIVPTVIHVLRSTRAPSPAPQSHEVRWRIAETDPAYNDSAKTPLYAGPAFDALTAAVKAWRAATGEDIPQPKLYRGWCQPIDAAIACADVENYSIIVTREGMTWDLPTVMMHEVGHLLGVGHMDGDELMDPVFQGALKKVPIVAAVAAMTRLAQNGRPWEHLKPR